MKLRFSQSCILQVANFCCNRYSADRMTKSCVGGNALQGNLRRSSRRTCQPASNIDQSELHAGLQHARNLDFSVASRRSRQPEHMQPWADLRSSGLWPPKRAVDAIFFDDGSLRIDGYRRRILIGRSDYASKRLCLPVAAFATQQHPPGG